MVILTQSSHMKKALILSTILAGIVAAGVGVSSLTAPAEAQAPNKAAQKTAKTATVQSGTVDFGEDDQLLLLALLQRGDAYGDPAIRSEISKRFDAAWIAPTLEVYNFVYDPTIRKHLLNELKQETGQDFGQDINRWFRWAWNQPEVKAKGYEQFKACLLYTSPSPRD